MDLFFWTVFPSIDHILQHQLPTPSFWRYPRERESQMKTLREEWPSRGGTRRGGSDGCENSWEREEDPISQEESEERQTYRWRWVPCLQPSECCCYLWRYFTQEKSKAEEKRNAERIGVACTPPLVYSQAILLAQAVEIVGKQTDSTLVWG